MIKMGYTHYWRMQDRISKSNWKKIKHDFLLINNVKEWKNNILTTVGNDKFTVTDDKILFNGIKENGHEWFVLDRKLNAEQLAYQDRLYGMGDFFNKPKVSEQIESRYIDVEEHTNFFFCKTARKPYDTCVVALLAIMKKHLGKKIKISSDGNINDWSEGLALCKEILGYNKFEFDESNIDEVELVEIKPISIKNEFSEKEILRMANIFSRRVLSNGLDFYGKRDKVILEKIRKMITENGEILVGFKKQDRGLGSFDKERRSKWITNEVEQN